MAVTPVLKRIDIVVLKDNNPPSDRTQVPAAATINFYKQGATVKVAADVPSNVIPDPEPTTVFVYNTGAIAIGDTVQSGTNASATMNVVGVDAIAGTMDVLNDTSTAIHLNQFERLVRSNSQPFAYKDPTGTVVDGTSINTDSTTGRAKWYMREFRFDYIITGAGDARLFVDADGGWVMRT